MHERGDECIFAISFVLCVRYAGLAVMGYLMDLIAVYSLDCDSFCNPFGKGSADPKVHLVSQKPIF